MFTLILLIAVFYLLVEKLKFDWKGFLLKKYEELKADSNKLIIAGVIVFFILLSFSGCESSRFRKQIPRTAEPANITINNSCGEGE